MLTVQHCCIASRFLYHCQSWCCMQTNYAASPQITLWASPESLLVFFNTNSKPRPLSLSLALCAAGEEPESVDTEGPVVRWESLGLPDLDCDEKPGWISSSSLAGELIQPGPQEAWTLPTHKHTLPQFGSLEKTDREAERELWKYQEWKKGRPASGGIVRDTACYGDEDTKVLIGLSWDEQRGGKRGTTRDWERSQTERSEKTLYPTGGKRLIKDQKLFRWLIYFFVVVKYYFIWMYLF